MQLVTSRQNSASPTKAIQHSITGTHATLKQICVKGNRLLRAVAIVHISPSLDHIRIDAGYWLAPLPSVEDHLPLTLGTMLRVGHSASINLVVDDGSAMHSPAHALKPLAGEVEAVYVTAEVEVGLGLGYS